MECVELDCHGPGVWYPRVCVAVDGFDVQEQDPNTLTIWLYNVAVCVDHRTGPEAWVDDEVREKVDRAYSSVGARDPLNWDTVEIRYATRLPEGSPHDIR